MMIGVSEASAALSSIKVAIDMVKGVHSLKSETDINQAIIDIQRTLLEAQSAALQEIEKRHALIDRIRELESRLLAVDDWAVQVARYALTEFPTGKFAYVLKDEHQGQEPTHRLCATCFEEKRRSILQTKNKHSGGESVMCFHCKDLLILYPFPKVEVVRGRRASSWLAY